MTGQGEQPWTPPTSAVTGVRPWTWSDEESVSFEVALEAISSTITALTSLIERERRRPSPDTERIAEWSREQVAAADERRQLRATDLEAVRDVRRRYADRVRALRQALA